MLMTIKRRLNRSIGGGAGEKRRETGLNRAPGGVSDEKRRDELAEVALIKHVQTKTPAVQTELDDIVVVSDVLW